MKRAVYWFRKNLRINDNPSLAEVIKNYDEIIFIYIKNESFFNPLKYDENTIGEFRKKFLDESVINLEKNLKKISIRLYIFDGDLIEIFTEINKNFKSNIVFATKEVGWYEESEEKILRENGFDLRLYEDQNLFELEKLPYDIEELPLIFTHFRKKVEKNVTIRNIEKYEIPSYSTKEFNFKKLVNVEHPKTKLSNKSAYPFIGGEDDGIKRLNSYLWETNNIENYKETRNGLVGTEYSSKFSAYLSLGCISPVQVYQEVKKYEKEVKKNSSTYWIIFELLWREFFRYVYLKAENKIFLKNGINGNIFSKKFNNNIDAFTAWKNGETGQDFIDANMIELKKTGFMSNRGRQNVASYLINDLDINWVWGASHFEKYLIDYDVTSNWCNWMYMAGVGNNTRNWVFNPERQSDMYDKNGLFRSNWLSIKKGQQNIMF